MSSSRFTSILQRIAGRLGYSVKRRRPGIRRTSGAALHSIHPESLMEAIHGKDIYEGFDHTAFAPDRKGWGGESAAFEELIRRKRPSFVIEVGSWKGASALTMAEVMQREGLAGKILCIDTWLGALEFWSDQSDPDRFGALECRHGYPSVYFRFLANVLHAGQEQRIVPFPLPASAAALWLMRTDLRADLIYLDGSHEEEDVYQDLLDYHSLLAPGGLLFGDDWGWSGVRAAVERFAAEQGIGICHIHDKWVLGA
jgi:hypothetical protein